MVASTPLCPDPLAAKPTDAVRWPARAAVLALGAASLLPGVSSAAALFAGIGVALLLENPWPAESRALAQRLLAASVVGLGAGMDLGVIGRVGLHGLGYTALGIGLAFAVGTWLGRRLGVGRDTAILISAGTAICGGSAIAAVAPTIRARPSEVSVALAAVFVLNAVALLAFPAVGQALHMDPEAFGLWCALAIHDTSSVVGAASRFGAHALEIATTAKLARALWILPVTFAIGLARARSEGRPATGAGGRRPWFIAGFLGAALVVWLFPGLRPIGQDVADIARRALAATLFLIGLGLSRDALRHLGLRPFLLALALWLTLGAVALLGVQTGWITASAAGAG